ncbi:hypothetical protein CDCA_CDCA02G0610 [Cyanidium caldarium]|uniref:Large ribosomal subunit protein uL11m n=1 Tax=Cyanidium caldarium TaxID=2771 RepID=A0AAV9IR75_CYACA|nr:hypothetical protein CDCA_CDCA02G0610 [Cyanidium caldarium]
MPPVGRKAVRQVLRMLVPAGKAAPGPPVGPRLGQLGLNIMQFCKDFNKATENVRQGTPLPTVITAYTDRTFTFVTRTPPVAYLLLRAAGVDKGSAQPGRQYVGEPVGLRAVYEIACIKQQDHHLQDVPLRGLCKCVLGTARSVGVRIVDDRDASV